MAKVQPLRPAAPRSPEREKLAAAIERRNTAVRELAAIRTAKSEAFEAYWAAKAAAEKAAEALAAAKANEPRRYVARLMGNPDPSALSVEAATAAVEKADSEVSLTGRARELLDAVEREAAEAIQFVELQHQNAIAAVGCADPAVAALIASYHAARRRVQELDCVMRLVLGAGMLPREEWHFGAMREYPHVSAATATWQAAVAALQTNPDAPLPSSPAPDAGEAA